MGEYVLILNLDKIEYISGLDITIPGRGYSFGIKLGSSLHGEVSNLLSFLCSHTSTYGKQMWAGDKILISGDYVIELQHIMKELINEKGPYKNVTKEAIEAWNRAQMSPELEWKVNYLHRSKIVCQKI
jgi:hypothetical protein